MWTTIGDGGDLAALAQDAQWLLLADARPMPLQRVASSPRDLGIDQLPLARPVRSATQVMFITDEESLDYVAAAAQLTLRRADGTDYAPWRDARRELQASLARRVR